jgi:hypothetical protein
MKDDSGFIRIAFLRIGSIHQPALNGGASGFNVLRELEELFIWADLTSAGDQAYIVVLVKDLLASNP